MLVVSILILLGVVLVLYIWNPRVPSREYDQEVLYDDSITKVHPQQFYSNYFGHDIAHLSRLHTEIREAHKTAVWLAGDSSLDNKHWLFNNIYEKSFNDSVAANARSVYAEFLEPPICLPDVAACLNEELKNTFYTALNCAIEESALCDRLPGKFPSHDRFIRENIREDDVLIVSVGGNDLALKPCFRTLFWLAAMWLSPIDFIPSYISDLFHLQVQRYVDMLTGETRPKLVIVCMFYYPCEQGKGWLDKSPVFRLYQRNSARAKTLLNRIFEDCTCKIKVEGTRVYPVHLGKVLDPTCADDYVSRVEPSAQGGRKMANLFGDIIQEL